MTNTTQLLSKNLQLIAENINKEIIACTGESIGFSLLVFTKGRASYISNCDRQDCIDQMEQLLGFWKKGMPDIKAHEVS